MAATAERPADEARRMAAVRRYDILDTPPDGAFDRITAMAARICEVPIATISVVDVDRIWFKSAHGVDVGEIGRDPGLCASAILQSTPYLVVDARTDPRTLDNPLVRGELGLRFYAGVPLVTGDGHRLGTLNVIDVEPRDLSDDQLRTLEDLAAVVMDELELRLAARRAVELEATREAGRYRDRLMSAITHEMRTPLAVLHGISSMDQAWDPQAGSEARDMMGRHVRHLDWLVTQFLEFARLEDGRAPIVRVDPMEVAAVVTEAVELFTAEEDVRLDLAPQLPTVVADRQRTVQILVELVSNALRVSPPGEPVSVDALADDAGGVVVSVIDHGPGLTPDELGAVLSDPRPTGVGARRGIGLYVARALADAQHSRLEVQSTPGQGTRFSLRLPPAP